MSEDPRPSDIPQDFEAEQAVLGTIIEDNGKITDIGAVLNPNSFHTIAHQHIYRAMLELDDRKEPVDEIMLGDQLNSLGQLDEIGGYAYLAELAECSPSTGNVIYYAKILQEHAMLRDLISVTMDIGRRSRDPEQNITELLKDAETKISEIAQSRTTQNLEHVKDSLRELFKDIEKKSDNRIDPDELKTGFVDLDRIIGGLLPPDLIVIGGRPSMGKTALALNIASYVATRGETSKSILVYSREMQNKQLAGRMISSSGRVDSKKLRDANLDQEDWDKLAMATDEISGSEIYLDSKTSDIRQLVYDVKSFDKRHKEGVALVIVDYLQLMRGSKDKFREQEIAEISRSLKNLAMDLNIPVIALSQLNRKVEERADKRPTLQDLRESGAIEQDSDIILFIYRDEVYNPDSPDKGIAEIIIAKNRNGSTGMTRLQFIGKYTKFSNLSLQNP